jgi:hypothetical protein
VNEYDVATIFRVVRGGDVRGRNPFEFHKRGLFARKTVVVHGTDLIVVCRPVGVINVFFPRARRGHCEIGDFPGGDRYRRNIG